MKRIISILVIISMMTSMVFAEGISDVDVDSWSIQYIEKVMSSDVMPAYDDDTFRPSERVTKMEVINVIYRIALLKGEVTEAEVDQYLLEHQSTINGLLIPNTLQPYGAENHKAIAYALDRDILRSSELNLFFTNGRFDIISKVDASVYMAKALNVYLEENVNKFYEIRYTDGSEITLMAWPYINLLIEKSVVSAEGQDGYFYPNSTLNRDIFSVIASGILREVEGYEKGEGTDGSTTSGATFDSTGRISIIHYDKNIIEIRDQYNNLDIYDATGAKLTLNGDTVALQNLEPGLDVKIKTNGKSLISLEVVKEYDDLEGEFRSASPIVNGSTESYNVVSIGYGATVKHFKLTTAAIIERDYQPSILDELVEEDMVTIEYEGKYIKKIASFSEKVVLEGAMQRSSKFEAGDAVSIKLFNDKMIEQVLETTATKYNFSDQLIKGDIVKVTLSKGQIISVEATGLTTEASGRLTAINISSSPSLTLVDSKGTTKTFNVATPVVVKNLGTVDSLGLYALRLDQDITVELSGVLVDKISINKAVEKMEFEAEITEVHANINLLKAIDDSGKEWIVSLEGSDQVISDYTIGDRVYIYGVELSQDLFEADLIIVLE